MKVTAIIDDTRWENSVEKVEISQQDSVIGEQIYTAFITIFDDGDNECTFHYRQIDDVIAALIEAKEKWEGRYTKEQELQLEQESWWQQQNEDDAWQDLNQ